MNLDIKQRIEQIKNGSVPEGYTNKYHIKPDSWKDEPLNMFFYKVKDKNYEKRYSTVFTNSAANGVIPQNEYFEKDIANEENIDGYYIVNAEDYIYNPRISEKAPYGPINQNQTGYTGIASPLYTVFAKKENICVCDEYIRYYLSSTEWNKYIYSVANYGARFDRMNISDNDFMNMPIALPQIDEQQKIAEILMQCDKVIELKQKHIEEEKKFKKWLLRRFFDKEDVRKKRIGDLCLVTMGQSPDSKSYNTSKEGVPLIQGNADVVNREPSPKSYTNEPTKMCEIDDILLSVRAPVGAVCKTNIAACLGRGMCSIRPHTDIEYIYQFLLYYEDKWQKISQGSTFESVSGDEIKKILVPINENIEYISGVLVQQDEKITLLHEELEQRQYEKKALMQLLLTGIVRVDV